MCEQLSTTPSSNNVSARSRTDHFERPSGASLHAVATSTASTSPSILPIWGPRFSRSKASSVPSSTQRFRNRSTVAVPQSNASATCESVQPGPPLLHPPSEKSGHVGFDTRRSCRCSSDPPRTGVPCVLIQQPISSFLASLPMHGESLYPLCRHEAHYPSINSLRTLRAPQKIPRDFRQA